MKRSGTSYACDIINEYFSKSIKDIKRIDPEVNEVIYWNSNKQKLLNQYSHEINELNLNTLSIDNFFVKTIFNHLIHNCELFVFKYFNMTEPPSVFSLAEIIQMINDQKIKVICMYRENVLSSILSKIVIDNFGYLETHNRKLLFESKYKFNKLTIVNYIYDLYSNFEDMITVLHKNTLINKILKFEDLTFDTTQDIRLLIDNIDTSILNKFDNSKEFVSSINYQNFDYFSYTDDQLLNIEKSYFKQMTTLLKPVSKHIVTSELKYHILRKHPNIIEIAEHVYQSKKFNINNKFMYKPSCL